MMAGSSYDASSATEQEEMRAQRSNEANTQPEATNESSLLF